MMLEQGRAKIVTFQTLEEKRNKLKRLKSDSIKLIEEIDFHSFVKVHTPNKEDPSTISFNKIWVWIMEQLYNTSYSKYLWTEFRDKVFKQDKGEELRRRMIMFNPRTMGVSAEHDLQEINEVHGKVVMDKHSADMPELSKLLEIYRLFLKQKEEETLYNQIKEKAVGEDDVEKNKQEKINDLKTKSALSQIKIGILTDMNNLFNMINSNFV